MANDEFFGENSQSGENSNGERPLKKARYAWQVKGKYHLKDNNQNIKKPCDEEKDIKTNSEICETEEIKDEPPPNFMRRNRHCINRLITQSEHILMDMADINDSNDDIPISMVTSKNSDYFLKKWQARQVAKGFIDNTINKVLETWMVAPFDATDFVENCENGGLVEDEGILMAIQSHGLLSGSRDGANTSTQSNDRNACADKESDGRTMECDSVGQCHCSQKRVQINEKDEEPQIPFHRRNNEYYEENWNNLQKPSLNVEDFCESKENESLEISDDNTRPEIVNLDGNTKNDSPEPFDFLDAAVSFAIQNKGLVSQNNITRTDDSG